MIRYLFLILSTLAAQAAGLGVYNPAQHSVNGFMPTQVTGLQVWLDSQKLLNTNGASIGSWKDLSGNLRDATNSTASTQPVLSTVNGRKCVQFDGVDDLLWFGSTAFDVFKNASQGTMYAVCIDSASSTGAASHLIIRFNTSLSGGRFGIFTRLTNSTGVRAGGRRLDADSFVASGVLLQSGFVVAAAVADWSNNSIKAIVNGTESATNAFSSGGGNTSNTSSSHATIGNDQVNANQLEGKIAEILVFDKVLNSHQTFQVSRYLGTKYGIVVK